MVVNLGCHSISGSSTGGLVLRSAKNAFLGIGWVSVGVSVKSLYNFQTQQKSISGQQQHKFQAQENDVDTATPQGKQPISVPYNSLKTCHV